MAEARKKGGDPTIVIVLIICVIVGMIQGARGLVHGASDGFRRAKVVAVENVDDFRGTLKVSTSACEDTPALDQVRYQVTNAQGSQVATVDKPLVAGRERQTADVGQGLAPGRYKVNVTCLCDGKPTGDTKSTRVTVRTSDARAASATQPRPQRLPHTGR
ncbi:MULTISPECIES: hypothetical protein [unclassified Luteococcus]|uniref:hypothetical protein n=1 Tax=unclassified Luteococcus TaxID=2639923 RepID=UPI00313CBCBF